MAAVFPFHAFDFTIGSKFAHTFIDATLAKSEHIC